MLVCRLPSPRQSLGKLALATAVTWLMATGTALADHTAAEATMPTVPLVALPVQAQHTEALIRQGGPFRYTKDGSVFGNRERLLPSHKRGYYREYTVVTPGAHDRGARRIVRRQSANASANLLLHGRSLRELCAHRAVSGQTRAIQIEGGT